MQFEVEKKERTLTVKVEGEINTLTAPELEEVIYPELPNIDDLIIDFEKVTYISSAGLRLLLISKKEIGSRGSVTVRNVGPEIKDVIDVTGFGSMLVFE